MARSIEFFFDVGSPTTYLAWTQLPQLADDTGASIVWRPMLLGGVFKATGNSSPVTVPAKGRWMLPDMQRWADRYRVPLRFNPHFPINTLTLMRGATGVLMHEPARLAAYLGAVFHAMWVAPRNMGDSSVVAEVLGSAGFEADAVQAWVSDPAVKAALAATTEEAVKRGVFGAPSMFVGDCLFFGQDRLEFVREALCAQALVTVTPSSDPG